MQADNPCGDYQPMTKEQFLVVMAEYWDRIMVRDQGFGLIQADFKAGLCTHKQHSVGRNQAVAYPRR